MQFYVQARFHVFSTGDDKGHVLVWHVGSNQSRMHKPLPEPATAIQACPSLSSSTTTVVAIGYKSGAVVVCQISLDHCTVLRTHMGHSAAIQALAWNTAVANQTAACMLASGACLICIILLHNVWIRCIEICVAVM
jgi:hypothetical protein